MFNPYRALDLVSYSRLIIKISSGYVLIYIRVQGVTQPRKPQCKKCNSEFFCDYTIVKCTDVLEIG